jgi:hypothetical protein
MANFQVRIDQVVGSQVVNNVTYWQFPDNLADTLQDFANSLRASYVTWVDDAFHTSWTYQSITCRQMDGGGAFTTLVVPTSGALAGTNTNNLLPYASALLISTGFLGPKPNRGRIYFGGLTEESNNLDATIFSTHRTNFEGLVKAWRDGLTTSQGSCFLRIARPNFTANNWTLNNPVESVIARTQWATQRRRRPGVGV